MVHHRSVWSVTHVMNAAIAVLLLSASISVEAQVTGGLASALGGLPSIVTQPVGRLISAVAAKTQVLDPMLISLLSNSSLPVLPSAVTTLLTGLLAEVVNVALPVPPPFKPNEEAIRLGYIGESFNLTTPDGYILEIFRIRSGNCSTYRSVLVVPPSVLANPTSFMLIEEESFVFRLANQCYDIYLLNCRGMLFARNHLTLSDQQNEFWDFEQWEYAQDIAQGIEFVYQRSGGRRLRMVALDQGGTSLFIINAFFPPRYQKMLASAYLYVPIANLGNLDSITFATLSAIRDAVSTTGALVLHDELAFMNPTIHSALYNLCSLAPLTCDYLFQLLGGPGDLYNAKFSYTFRNVLDSTSIKAFNFFLNMIGKVGYFKLYDYGSGNLARYGTPYPPDIPLNATTLPCTVVSLTTSTVTVREDVHSTFTRLAPSAQVRLIDINSDSLAPLVPRHPELIYSPVEAALAEDLTRFPE